MPNEFGTAARLHFKQERLTFMVCVASRQRYGLEGPVGGQARFIQGVSRFMNCGNDVLANFVGVKARGDSNVSGDPAARKRMGSRVEPTVVEIKTDQRGEGLAEVILLVLRKRAAQWNEVRGCALFLCNFPHQPG